MGFQLHVETMKKYCEPVLVLCPILFAAVCSSLPLAFGLYNPSPYESSCILYTKDREDYAIDSKIEETSFESISTEEAKGFPSESESKEIVSISRYNSLINTFVSYLSINLIVIVASFITLFIAFRKKEMAKKEEYVLSSRLRQQTRRTRRTSRRQIKALHHETRCMKLQAAAYISVYAFTHVVFIYGLRHADSPSNAIFTSSIVPLQGIFNCIIFIAHKCHALRLSYEGSFLKALKFVLFGMNTQDPILFHDFNLVRQDQLQKCGVDDSSIKSDEIVLPISQCTKKKTQKTRFNQNRNLSSVTYTGVRFDLSNFNDLDTSQHAKQEISSSNNLFLEDEENPVEASVSRSSEEKQETVTKSSSSYKVLQGFSFGDDFDLTSYRNYQREVEEETNRRIAETTRNNSSLELDLDEFHIGEEFHEERTTKGDSSSDDRIEEDEVAKLDDFVP